MIGLSLQVSIATAAIILAVGLAGDLAVSALKRSRGKKDFMPLLPLHGGALDIYDSFLLAAPAAFLLRLVLSSVTHGAGSGSALSASAATRVSTASATSAAATAATVTMSLSIAESRWVL